jgi:hypothetical protein
LLAASKQVYRLFLFKLGNAMLHKLSSALALTLLLSASVSFAAGDSTPADSASPAPAEVTAASAPVHFGFSGHVGYEYGGDKLIEVTYTDGSTATLRGGTGFNIGLGGNIRPSKNSPWDVSLVGGYKLDQASASNGTIKFDRFLAEMIGSYTWTNKFRVGAGPVYHFNPKIKGDGFVPDVNLKNSFGEQIQIGWSYIALTYTFIRYKDDYNETASGNNFGLRLIGNF